MPDYMVYDKNLNTGNQVSVGGYSSENEAVNAASAYASSRQRADEYDEYCDYDDPSHSVEVAVIYDYNAFDCEIIASFSY